MALGRGADVRLAESISPPTRPLRQADRHPRGVLLAGVRADLLAIAAKALDDGLSGFPLCGSGHRRYNRPRLMSLSAGTRLGPYEIVAPIGAGGMGEVYRARDTKLGREVAIKILLPAVANGSVARRRCSRR